MGEKCCWRHIDPLLSLLKISNFVDEIKEWQIKFASLELSCYWLTQKPFCRADAIMKISGFDTLHADAGRSFSFLKITTDEGITGWSEYTGISEIIRRQGLTALIESMAQLLVGRDPREVERLTSDLYSATRQSLSGLNHQAIGAIQNALLDIAAKALDVPVYRLFGGPLRTRIPLYWSHFGTYRLRRGHEIHQKKLIRDLDGMAAHAQDVLAAGYPALKTKIHYFDETGGTGYFPCFGSETGAPELNLSQSILKAIVDQMTALREAVGDELDLILDLNSNFKTDGIIRIARATEHLDIRWLEVDVDEIMSRLIADELIPPVMVVSVWNLPDVKRRTEYMPQKPVTEQVDEILRGESDITREAITSDNYLKFLVSELKPFIDKTYRTKPDSKTPSLWVQVWAG